MEWTDIRLTVAKADADNAEAVATMIAEGGIYIEDYSDIEHSVMTVPISTPRAVSTITCIPAWMSSLPGPK